MIIEHTTHPLLKLTGFLASAGLTAFSGLMANMPEWAGDTREWVLLATGIIGIGGVSAYTLSFALDCKKKWREERAAHRNELREIEDAACRRRQASGECPRCAWAPPTGEK